MRPAFCPMQFSALRASYVALNVKVRRCMAATDCIALCCGSRCKAVPATLFVFVLAVPLCGCSFDLGSTWGSDKEKPPRAEQQPTGTISGENVSDAQG